jgi:predicted ester cyclase
MSENDATIVTIVRRFYSDLIAQGRLERTADLLAPDYVDHVAGTETAGIGGFSAWLAAFDRAFRNRVVALEDVTLLGDFVSVRWSGSFTHTGVFAGYEATGRTLDVSGVTVFRTEDGKIGGRWEKEVTPGLMRQLALARSERAALAGVA